MTPTIVAEAACHLSEHGWSAFGKADEVLRVPASTMKVMTLFVARQYITDGMLHETVMVTADDMMGGSTAQLQVGDVVSWDDLFHGLILPSGNDAANCIARVIGDDFLLGEVSGATAVQRFRVRMGQVATGQLGWTGAVFGSPSGNEGNSRLTPRMLCELVLALDAYSVAVGGALTHTMTISGENARTYDVEHTIDPDGAVKFPEFVSGKTGTFNGANVVVLWDGVHGRHATAVLGSDAENRFPDLRLVMDYAESVPPPQPPAPVRAYSSSWGPVVVDDVPHPVIAVDMAVGGTLVAVWRM